MVGVGVGIGINNMTEILPDIIVIDDEKDSLYKTINLSILLDNNLSWKAKGIFYYIRTRPKGWKLWIKDLINKSTDGEGSVRAGINELIDMKVLYRGPIRDEKKRIKHWIYVSFSRPTEIEKLHLEKLLLENLNVAFLHVENQVYSNKIYSKNNNNISFNKLKEDMVSEKPNSFIETEDNINDYETKVQEAFEHWQSLKIVRHKIGKTKNEGLRKLHIFMKKYGLQVILNSMDTYKELLEDEYSILENRSPYKVGLNEFFGFNKFTKESKGYKQSKLNIKSWFHVCKDEKNLQKFSRLREDSYPKMTAALKRQFSERVYELKESVQEENTFRKASEMVMLFFNEYKSKMNISEEKKRYPHLFADKVMDYLVEQQGDKHPGWLCIDFFCDSFYKWLEKKGIMED